MEKILQLGRGLLHFWMKIGEVLFLRGLLFISKLSNHSQRLALVTKMQAFLKFKISKLGR